MKFPTPIPVTELAQRFDAQLIGDKTLFATGINEIHKVKSGDIVFADVSKYFNKCIQSAATIILLPQAAKCPAGKVILVVENPFEVYDTLVREHRPFRPISATISPDAIIGEGTIIEPNAIIAANVSIGKNCHIQANVVISAYSVIGDHVTIQAGSIIGTDAFYFKKKGDTYQPFCSGGRVVIEDNVQIGAGCTINKGVSGDTIIGAGSKLDCQVHLGHGVVLGKNCLLAAQVGIGGKTVLGDNVVLYGQVGVAQNITIGDNVVVLAKSGISKKLESNKTYFGYPAGEVRVKYRELAALRHLPDFYKEFYK